MSTQDNDLERLARKHAGAKLGWYIHASIYLAVNLMLVLMSVIGGRHWAVFPLLGWGLGLAIHGIVVLLRTGRLGLHERMVQRERERLARRDTW
jgi:hypothetical protein